MRYFPIFVDLDRQPVLVVGGGEQAAQKVRLLRKTRAAIRVAAPRLNAELAQLASRGLVQHVGKDFTPELVEGCRLVYATSEDAVLNARVSLAARARGVPVNVVDTPQHCSFITPALVDRDPVVVAIGSEGTAPVLVRRIKSLLEAQLPARLGALARFAGAWRRRVGEALRDGAARRRFWEGFFDGPIAHDVLRGREDEAEEAVEAVLTGSETSSAGRVTLVGAGPGDPDLLTLAAARALQAADVIVLDRLVGDGVLELARRDAERIHVGKTPGGPSTSQDEINAILVREASSGKRVVRLKGGDPLVFGRAAEEIAALEAAGIEVDIIPGITAAVGAAARARLMLTERQERRALTIMTGHAADGHAEHDWQALARPGQALAIYMGVGAAATIERNLLAAGIDPKTPVTIVENATLPQEKVARGRIDGLTSLVIDERIKGPAMIFVGAAPLAAAMPEPAALRTAHLEERIAA